MGIAICGISFPPGVEPREAFRLAAEGGLEIASVTGGLYWTTSFISDDPAVREKALEIAQAHLRAAAVLGAGTVLVVPGVVHAFFIENCPVVRYDLAYDRALAAVKQLAPLAEELNVHIDVENVSSILGYFAELSYFRLGSTRPRRRGQTRMALP